jgi:Topoisomerase DNA binding C4 zinc finger
MARVMRRDDPPGPGRKPQVTVYEREDGWWTTYDTGYSIRSAGPYPTRRGAEAEFGKFRTRLADDAGGMAPLEGDGETCPECGTGTLTTRRGRFGTFLNCSRHPDCRYFRRKDRPHDAVTFTDSG